MTINSYQVQEFMNYFSGSQHNYGKHIYDKEDNNGKKREGHSETVTNKLLTIEEYTKHLKGETGLGVIPINERSKCKFAVIDIDIYNYNFEPYLNAIENFHFPIVPFKSKSGGYHLYTFFKEEIPAKTAVAIMREFSFLLSISTIIRNLQNRNIEIFPKQTKLAKEDVGSWINLPYFGKGALGTKAIRGEKELNLSEALLLIKDRVVSINEVKEFLSIVPYQDAPPCLQAISILNNLDQGSGRNNYLFSFGVYFKKKDEEFFEQSLLDINDTLSYPISEKELDKTIVNSLKKKDYIYKCNDVPCVDFCNKSLCKKREYGIGKDDGYFSTIEMGQLYQYKTASPYYEWQVKLQGESDYKLLRFRSEDEIIRQDVFLRLCMRELYELPSKLKAGEWFKRVNEALSGIKIIEVHEDEDTSPIVAVKNYIIEFLTGRAQAENKEQLLAKRPYYNIETSEYYFRVKDLSEFVFIIKRYNHFTSQELHGILRDMGSRTLKLKTETGKQVRVTALKKDVISNYDFTEDLKMTFEITPEEDF